MMTQQKHRIGAILEVRTACGLAYVQYTHYKKPYGTLIRVLPGCFQSRPTNFSEIARRKELYFVFCPVESLFNDGLLELIANESIPDFAKGFPAMRKRGRVRPIAKGGGVSHWTIVDGEKESRVEKLTSEQARLSIASIWSLGMLAKRKAEGWQPEMDVGFRNVGQESKQGHESIRFVKHFLYLPTEAAALRVQKVLSRGTRSVKIKPSAKGEQWLVLVSDPNSQEYSVAQARTELENLTREQKGEYDGWEMDVGDPKRCPDHDE